MIENSIQLGDPVEHVGVVVVPLFPRHEPKTEYLTLEEVLPLGFRITEVDAAGSVPELVAFNPLDKAVLLYDGEELLGAKQNRILNVTVLVGGRSETRIPVSCVEEGRWSARSTSFAAARHAAYPELRRQKADRLSAEPLARGAAQSIVWEAVAAKAVRHGVHSPTRAAADIYKSQENALSKLRRAFPRLHGQSGAVLALGDQICLDYVSRPNAFAGLYPKLLEGYMLDGLEYHGKPARTEQLTEFLAALPNLPHRRSTSAGLGDDLRLAGKGLVASGLAVDHELVQLSAFTSDRESAQTRVVRPSRRR
jgi:hypothetical protein